MRSDIMDGSKNSTPSVGIARPEKNSKTWAKSLPKSARQSGKKTNQFHLSNQSTTMKNLIGLLLAVLFVSITGTITVQAIEFHLKDRILEQSSKSILPHVEPGNFPYVIHRDHLIPTAQKGPVYYVKIGDTISLLKDPQGYKIAAERMGMETIKVVPDKSGKYYRTVSLDLNQSDEDLKKAIEVKVSEIIVK